MIYKTASYDKNWQDWSKKSEEVYELFLLAVNKREINLFQFFPMKHLNCNCFRFRGPCIFIPSWSFYWSLSQGLGPLSRSAWLGNYLPPLGIVQLYSNKVLEFLRNWVHSTVHSRIVYSELFNKYIKQFWCFKESMGNN